MGVIYKIISPTNKVYVGKTYDLRKRINEHRRQSKNGSNLILHNSIRKYGWETHILEVIEEVEDSLLNEREMHWIEKLKTYCYENPLGLNMTRGGEGQRSTWMHKTELRKWFSEKFSGSGNPFYGKTHTEEFKIEQSKRAARNAKDKNIKVPKWGYEKGLSKIRKAIILYDKSGRFLGEYVSITDCSNKTGVGLQNLKDSVVYGSWINGQYLAKYKTENYPLKIEVGEIKMKTVKRPVVLMTEDYEEIAEFPSSQEASEFTGVPKTTINRAAQYNNLVPIRTGQVFVYRDDYDVLFKEAI